MKRNILLILFFCLFFGINAQAQNINISGTVFDDLKEPIEMASIRILNAKDSAYVTGTVTDTNGKFNIGIKQGRYITHISFIGYSDQFINVNPQKASIGNIYMKEDAIMLGEAVVEAKAIEVQVKGDTVEYNADSYRSQENEVIEDLLKRMPGAEVDENGKITINGKEVKKFLVDGKEFFSNDPKVASKNLPASMIEKLQVLDRKSDMSQMTGFDDGEDETVINLTIKKGMKQGVFGNAFAGMGSKDRYEANGMVNYMRNNSQYTLLGGINNTNNAGFSDLATDMFSGHGGGRLRFGGANNGVAKTINGGFNFATEYSDILKYGGNIRYGSIDNDVSSVISKRYTGTDQTEATNSYGNNRSDNFNANLRFEWTPDSDTKIIFRPNIQYNKNWNDQISENATTFSENSIKDYTENANSHSEGKGLSLSGDLDISRKLNSEGRTLSFSFSGGLNNSDSEGYDYSHSLYANPLKNDSIRDQKSLQDDKGYNWRAFVSYVEPLGRNNFLQLTYNIKGNHSETDKKTYNKDAEGNYNVIAEEYTRNVKNDFLNQNVSLNFKSVRENFDYTLGVGLEPSRSKTSIYQPGEEEKDIKPRNFLSFAPNGQFNYRWDKRHNIRLDYSGRTTQPSTTQLYDGIISQNGFNVTYGNPELSPSFTHRLRLRFQKFNTETMSNMMVFGNFNYTTNDIVNVTTYKDQGRETTYKNVDGNMDGNIRFILNSPLKNKKFSINTMTMGRFARSNTFVDLEENRANIYGFQENLGLQFRTGGLDDVIKTLKDTKVLFNISGTFSYSNIKNSISTNSDQEIFNYGGKGDFTTYLPHGLTLQSDIQYSTNSGYTSGYKLNEWLWNASVAYNMDPLMKGIFKHRYTGNTSVRFKIYDILQERSNISNQQTAQYIQESISNTINSYFMVHLIYKFQIFGKGTKSSDLDTGNRGWGDRGHGPGGPPP